jgi:hypothetical protein
MRRPRAYHQKGHALTRPHNPTLDDLIKMRELLELTGAKTLFQVEQILPGASSAQSIDEVLAMARQLPKKEDQ